MNPWFLQLSQQLPGLRTRAELLDALSDLEDHYDHFNEVDQEVADRLIVELNRRIDALSVTGD